MKKIFIEICDDGIDISVGNTTVSIIMSDGLPKNNAKFRRTVRENLNYSIYAEVEIIERAKDFTNFYQNLDKFLNWCWAI